MMRFLKKSQTLLFCLALGSSFVPASTLAQGALAGEKLKNSDSGSSLVLLFEGLFKGLAGAGKIAKKISGDKEKKVDSSKRQWRWASWSTATAILFAATWAMFALKIAADSPNPSSRNIKNLGRV